MNGNWMTLKSFDEMICPKETLRMRENNCGNE